MLLYLLKQEMQPTPVTNSFSMPSASVSASPTNENNTCKVDDPKCDGAQMNYNAGFLLLIGFIAYTLA